MSVIYINSYQFAAAAPLLLDTYSGAAAAYSLRQLRTGVTNVVRVRRDNDNAESDFTATEVSDGTLAAWVGAGNDGFVRTWYDQSGNGNDATQATAASQPKIVSNGALLTDSGNGVIRFDGSNDGLRADTLASSVSGTDIPLSAFCLWSTTSPASPYDVVFGFGNASLSKPGLWAGGGGGQLQFVRKDNSNNLVIISPLVQSTQSLFVESVISLGDTSSIYYNSSFAQSGTAALGTNTINRFAIGQLVRTSISNQLAGNVTEVILYPSDQSANRAAIEANINAHYSIF